MKVRTLILNLLTMMPISSVAFAAGSELSALSNRQEVTLDQVAELFDKRFFSNAFYNEAASLGLQRAEDLVNVRDSSNLRMLLSRAKEEINAEAMSGSSRSEH